MSYDTEFYLICYFIFSSIISVPIFFSMSKHLDSSESFIVGLRRCLKNKTKGSVALAISFLNLYLIIIVFAISSFVK